MFAACLELRLVVILDRVGTNMARSANVILRPIVDVC